MYRFNGKEKDYESGFHYYGARYYWSGVLTGWLSVDPIDAANLVYCAGEPDWSYVAFGSYLTTGNYHAALSELGKMWGNALSSPSFYIASTLSVLSMSKTSSVKQILRDIRNIESSGGYVKINPLNPRNNQKINMTIGNSSRKIDLRIESHPLPKKLGGNGVSPQPHMNVDYYENGVKIKTYHIILEQ